MTEKRPFEPMTDKYIDEWVKDITTDHYSPMPDDPDVLAVAAQAKEANALREQVERMKDVCEKAEAVNSWDWDFLLDQAEPHPDDRVMFKQIESLSDALAKLNVPTPPAGE